MLQSKQAAVAWYVPAGPAVLHLRRAPHGRYLRVARDQALYRAGDAVDGVVYLVRFGAFKTCVEDTQGGAAITAFQLRNDVLGLEALGLRQHGCSCVALEDSEVYEVNYRSLPQSHLVLHQLLSIASAQTRAVALMLRGSGAEQRLAAFLLNMSSRYAAAGCSPHCFRLQMARLDIAGFLGLTAESVSRGLARLRAAGVIALERRLVTVCDQPRLREIASSERMLDAEPGACA